jgi:hypothetical protein
MPSWWVIAVLIPAVVLALFDWRKGLFAMIIIAFLQDPARKIEVDRPVYFTLLVGAVFTAAYIGAQTRTRFTPGQIPGWKHFLRTPFLLVLVLLVAEAARALVLYGNPIIVGIGALSYLAPLPALLAGYHFALKRGRAGIELWLKWYLVAALIVLPTILLEYMGFDWPVLGDVGEGFLMFQEDAILTAHSGFFRASEIAAWHVSTAVSLLLLLSSLRRISTKRIVAVVAIIAALLAIGVLTGRRKIFVEITLFISIYVSLLSFFGKGGARIAIGAIAAGILSYVAVTLFVDDQVSMLGDARYQRYAERSASVRYDLSSRFFGLGLDPVRWAIQGFGWLGGGLGVASQGSQHYGGGAAVFGGAGEGGLGKITAELGLPGLALALWLGIAGMRYGWHVLVFVSRRSAPVARLAYGLAAFLIANLAVFFVATQLFGDLFILLVLGLMAGFFLATPILAEREQRAKSARARPVPSSRPVVVPDSAQRPVQL